MAGFSGYDSGGWGTALKNRLGQINASRNLSSALSSVQSGSPYNPSPPANTNTPFQNALGNLSSGIQKTYPSPLTTLQTHYYNGGGGEGGGGGINSSPQGNTGGGGGGGSKPVTTPGGGTQVSASPGRYSGGGGLSLAGNPKWYGNQVSASLPNLQKDQDMQAYVYGKANGLSDYAIQQLQQYVDPYSQYLVQNAAGNKPAGTTQDILNYSGGMYDYAMKKAASNAGNQFNPGQIMATVLSAPGVSNTTSGSKPNDAGTSTLGVALYGNPDPSTQVSAVKEYVTTALKNVISDEELGAYLKTIDQQGMAFVNHKNTAGNQKLSGNFGQWLKDRLGPTGGI